MSDSKTKGMIALPARLLFSDLIVMGGAPGFAPKYSGTFQIPKEGELFANLWAACVQVAEDTWGAESQTYLDNWWGSIAQGIAPNQSTISVQDGDLFNPDQNQGFYLIKASRREDQGPPAMLNIDGEPVNDLSEAARPGDGVLVMINVWAMKKHNRCNFTVEGVRLAQRGAALGGPNPAVIQAGLQALSQASLPVAIEGVQVPAELPQGQPQAAPVASQVTAQATHAPAPVAQPPTAGWTPPTPTQAAPTTGPVAAPQGPPAASMFEQPTTEAETSPPAGPQLIDLG